jgi:RNA polymerase sigma factor (TIGR02999 family)
MRVPKQRIAKAMSGVISATVHGSAIARTCARIRSVTHPQAGSSQEQSALFASLYSQLRRIAQRELRRRSGGLSLSATTLLHEAYFKMKQRSDAAFPDESHFLAYASRAMRTLVIDYARSRQAEKRGGAFHITRLPTEVPEALTEAADLERLGTAIDALGVHDTALAQLVEPASIVSSIDVGTSRLRSYTTTAWCSRRACSIASRSGWYPSCCTSSRTYIWDSAAATTA